MSTDADPREDALARIAALEARLAAHAEEARALLDELAAVRAAVEGIPVAPEREPEPEPAPSGDPDLSGARLVALDMVMSGVPRDEAVLRLAADFPGVDVATLLDEAATSRG
jgi:hypothetical protein